jgi:WD40 repeat protein
MVQNLRHLSSTPVPIRHAAPFLWTVLGFVALGYPGLCAHDPPPNERALFRHVPFGKGGAILKSIAFSPQAKMVATTDGHTVKIWDAANVEEATHLQDFRFGPGFIAFSPDGKILATTGFKEPPRLYDTATWAIRHKLTEDDESTRCVAFSPDSKILATVGFSGQISLWDVATGKKRKAFAPGLEHLQRVLFSPDSATLAAGGHNQAVLWDIAKNQRRATLQGHDGLVQGLAFSRDGKLLITADVRGKIQVWGEDTSKPKLELDADKTLVRRVGGIALSPDARTLAIVGFSPYVHLWDVDKGREWARLGMAGLGVEMDAVAFSPDGQTIVAGCADGAARVWDVPKRKPEKNTPKK